MKKPIVFAPLIRVSTEKQAKRGESLATQKKQLQSIINDLNGEIYHWYSGQEHATAGHERAILKELIRDAVQKKFEAVIVTDLSRWSRNNGESKIYLDTLRAHGIRFFVGSKEMNFNDPHDLFIVGMSVEVAELYAGEQARKSIDNRIEKAKKGFFTAGKLPWGRSFNKETGKCEIIPESKETISEIARQYLEEDISFSVLGKKFGMNPSNIHKILTKRCGDKWQIKFKSKRFNIDETITIEIPRLLSEKTIQRIRDKCEARKTWEHGAYKFNYLFSRIIFDKITGYALTGTPNSRGQRYYKSYQKAQQYMVNADVLEKAVTDTFFEALGNNVTLLTAVFESYPDMKETENLEVKMASYKKELKVTEDKISNISNAIIGYKDENFDYFITQLHGTIKELEKDRSSLKFKINSITNQLKIMPTKDEVESKRKKMREDIARMIEIDYFRDGLTFQNMSFADKRKIIRLVFGGKDDNGKKYGIYIKFIDDRPKQYDFEAYGRLGIIYGTMTKKKGDFESCDPDNSIITSADSVISGINSIVRDSQIMLANNAEDESTCALY